MFQLLLDVLGIPYKRCNLQLVVLLEDPLVDLQVVLTEGQLVQKQL
jgi:hypothetical protein